MAYIYRIDVGKRYYYGSTDNAERRRKQHFASLQKGDHHNAYLQSVYNDSKDFRFEVVEHIPDDQKLIAEQRYLDAHVGDPACVNASACARGGRVDYKMVECWGRRIGDDDAWWEYFESLADAERATGAGGVGACVRESAISTKGWVFIGIDPTDDPDYAVEAYIDACKRGRSRAIR
jgi:hypothetical protein